MRVLVAGVVLVVAIAACSAERTSGPDVVAESISTPKDTGRTPAIGFADVSGKVLRGGVGVGGATVSLYHNVLVDGRGVSQFVSDVTAAADGSFSFKQIPFGWYLLRSGTTGLGYLDAHATTVKLDVWVQ